MAVLRAVLTKYHAEALREWTWFLVRSEDWRPFLLERGLNSNIPAFTCLAKRQTFFERALVMKASVRTVQLSQRWRMPVEDVLDLAVRHELGHALCNERNEARADRAAIALKEGKPLSCQATLAANSGEGRTRDGR